jgi:hypothetical protein
MLRPAEALVVLTGDADAVRPGLEAADLGPIEVIRPSDDGVAEDRAAD